MKRIQPTTRASREAARVRLDQVAEHLRILVMETLRDQLPAKKIDRVLKWHREIVAFKYTAELDHCEPGERTTPLRVVER
jgi:hypothetical protein